MNFNLDAVKFDYSMMMCMCFDVHSYRAGRK